MYGYHDWLVIRELALSLIFVLLLCASIIAGVRQQRKLASHTKGMIDQDTSTASRTASATSVFLRTDAQTSLREPRRAA